MASLQPRKSSKGKSTYRLQFYDLNGGRQSKSLGKIGKKNAHEIKGHVEELLEATKNNTAVPAKSLAWVENEATDDLIEFLARLGFCRSRERSTLDAFIRSYIESRKDAMSNTIRNFENSRRKIVDYFQADLRLDHITPGDADDWRQWLVNQGLSGATISKAVKHAKQFFRVAKRKNLVRKNPFQHLVAGGEENETRKFFVERSIADIAIDHAPDIEWKLIIALARYGGLRCPSEIRELKWSDINWETWRISVSSPKTKHQGKPFRMIPMFPEIRQLLADGLELAPKGAVHVVNKYRANANLRTPFERILKRAGIHPWPRLFQNLRASRETELANKHPLHVVTAWLGNTELVARKHYLQVTDEHFAMASGAKSGPNAKELVRKSAPQRTAGKCSVSLESQTPERDTTEVVGPLGFTKTGQVPPRGVEPLFSG